VVFAINSRRCRSAATAARLYSETRAEVWDVADPFNIDFKLVLEAHVSTTTGTKAVQQTSAVQNLQIADKVPRA